MKKHKKYLANPYMAALFCTGFLLMLGACVGASGGAGKTTFVMVGIAVSLMSMLFFFMRRQIFSTIEIGEDGVIFRAPFCEECVFLYRDVTEFGMDYGTTSSGIMHCIYFCKKPFDPKFRHNIVRMPYSENCMRMQYSANKYRKLYDTAPENIKKCMPEPWTAGNLFERVWPQQKHCFIITKDAGEFHQATEN